MRVRELIELLESFEPEANVVVAKDAEGNAFAECTDIGSELMSDDCEITDQDDPFGEVCVILWP